MPSPPPASDLPGPDAPGGEQHPLTVPPAQSPDHSHRPERPLLAAGLREARRRLDAFRHEELADEAHYADAKSVLETLGSPHHLLLEAVRRSETIASTDPDEALFFRTTELNVRFSALVTLSRTPNPRPQSIAEAGAAYLGTAHRLLDLLVLGFLNDDTEIELARARHRQRLEEGLAVRRSFADFRIAIERGQRNPQPADRLRSALAALTALLRSETRRWLRASDRNVFRGLEERLETALASADPEGQRAAEAIYSDLVSTTGILSAISHREELRNRDLELAYQLPDTLLGPAPDELVETLRDFYGVCAPLDTALAEGRQIEDRHLKALRAKLGLP